MLNATSSFVRTLFDLNGMKTDSFQVYWRYGKFGNSENAKIPIEEMKENYASVVDKSLEKRSEDLLFMKSSYWPPDILRMVNMENLVLQPYKTPLFRFLSTKTPRRADGPEERSPTSPGRLQPSPVVNLSCGKYINYEMTTEQTNLRFTAANPFFHPSRYVEDERSTKGRKEELRN